MPDRAAQCLSEHIPLLRSGIRITADSCSIILLNRLSLLVAYAHTHTMLLTRMVYDEITNPPQEADSAEDTSLYKKLLTSGTISVHTAEAHPVPMRASLSITDLTLITAFNTFKPDGILTDDKALCRYCREHAIPYINTPMALFTLLYNGQLSHDQYTAALNALYEIGRYGQFIRDYMQDLYTSYCSLPQRVQ
jgi:hypothetical protein